MAALSIRILAEREGEIADAERGDIAPTQRPGVIGSQDYLSGTRARDLTLVALFGWLATRNAALAQFNHPSSKGALQWDNLAFVRAAAANVAAIEIHGDQGSASENLTHSDAGWYWLALARGWTVGPVMN